MHALVDRSRLMSMLWSVMRAHMGELVHPVDVNVLCPQ